MEYLEESGQGDVFIQCSEMDWNWKLTKQFYGEAYIKVLQSRVERPCQSMKLFLIIQDPYFV